MAGERCVSAGQTAFPKKFAGWLAGGPPETGWPSFATAEPSMGDAYLSFSTSSIAFVKLLTTLDSAR